MRYENGTSHYLKEGHSFPDFAEYTAQRLEQLSRPISAPCYALPGEQEQLNKLSADIQASPYKWSEKRSDKVMTTMKTMTCEMLTRREDPLLYDCVQGVCTALGFPMPTTFVYTPEESAPVYGVRTIGTAEAAWLFVSKGLRKNNLLTVQELYFIIGRSIGGAAAHHDEIATEQGLDHAARREQAFTADRAGLLATLWCNEQLFPAVPSDETVANALKCAKSAIHKLMVLNKGKKSESSGPELAMKLESTPIPRKSSGKWDNVPTDWERITALDQFVSSIFFLQCVEALWGKGNRILAGMLQSRHVTPGGMGQQ